MRCSEYPIVNSSSLCRKSVDYSPPESNGVVPVHSHTGSPLPAEHSKGQLHFPLILPFKHVIS